MMLQACARRKVEDEWDGELVTKPKLALVKLLKEKGGESRCLDVADKGKRRMMMMIRGGTAPLIGLNVEGGGVSRERREHVGSVIWGRWKMYNIGCWSARDGRMSGWTFFSLCHG